MAADFEVKVTGIPDLRAALRQVVPKLRKNALRQALAAGARLIRQRARELTRVIRPGDYAVRKGYRKPGTVKKAISVRTSKLASRRGDVGVFVNVRPLKRAARGAKNPADPFYWRWLEFGWNPASRATGGSGAKGRRERRNLNVRGDAKLRIGDKMLQKAALLLPQALQVFLRQIGPRIQKLNAGKNAQP